jgi:predicted amidohydrolase YtcJ
VYEELIVSQLGRTLFGLIFLAAFASCDELPEADIIFWGGAIYTSDDAQPMVEVVAIKDGVIIYAGDVGPGRSYAGEETLLYELKDKVLFPGFADAHVHLLGVGEREVSLDLKGATSVDNLIGMVMYWKQVHPDEKVIVGRGWIETHWPENRAPTRLDIDELTGKTPTILVRADGHALLVNTAALKAAGITHQTASPTGGEILKFADGSPTGMLIDAAQGLVLPLIPERTSAEKQAFFKKAIEVYASRGWVHAHNMSVALDEIEILEDLADAGQSSLKIYNSVNGQDAAGFIGTGQSRSMNGLVRTRAVKLYVDGALGSRGAALLLPYKDHASYGLTMIAEEDISPILDEALRRGIQINIHAIGDRGNRMVLDWYERAFASVPPDERRIEEPRWRIEHAKIVHPDDLGRFGQLGVIASMQPSHAIGDLHFAAARLGEERLKGAYAWNSLIASGAIVAAGSDAPVEVGDPMIEFYAATARRDLKGYAANTWHPEEAVSRQNALKMLTLWPAFASFQDQETGSIEVGKKADFTVLSANIMIIPEDQIPQTHALMTLLNGEVVFETNGAPEGKRIGE